MPYQIFTRQSHVGGNPTPGNRPRRSCVVQTQAQARAYCAAKNERRSKAQVRDGFFYEYAEITWYNEAFGPGRSP